MFCATCHKSLKSRICSADGSSAVISAVCKKCNTTVVFSYNCTPFYQFYNSEGIQLNDGYGLSPYCE